MAASSPPSTSRPPSEPTNEEASSATTPPAPEVDLRDPFVAVLLAFLVPGAGHLYQRRYAKAVIYAVCVFGLFGWGMNMAEGKCVSFRPLTGPNAGNRKEFIHYIGQVGTGLVALPAIVQYRRYFSPENDSNTPGQSVNARFEGVFQRRRTDDSLPENEVPLVGTVTLVPRSSAFIGLAGTATVTDPDGREFVLEVSDANLDNPIDVTDRRELSATVLSDRGIQSGTLEGSIPRPFFDRFEVPLSSAAEKRINTELGTTFDLAAVITMIAGLLNFLAMYDAYAGPAYGYDASPTAETEASA